MHLEEVVVVEAAKAFATYVNNNGHRFVRTLTVRLANLLASLRH